MPSKPLPLPEGVAPDEAVQLPTIQPPNAPDALDNVISPTIPDSHLSFDSVDHLDPTVSLLKTEGATTADHPFLSPTESASTPTPAPRQSQRSTAGLPPD